VEPLFIDGNALAIFHDLLDEIASAHLSVVNLECPLVSRKTPINKAGGWTLGAAAECVRGFVAAKWQVLNLANNHSFDQGAAGLGETMYTIRKAGINVVGAGSNIQEAGIPFITQFADQRIVIYSMAEREYSVAHENGAGANPLDLINVVAAIHAYKKGGVFIVLLHGGAESLYPSPEMVKRCRFMVDMGADAIVCSHSHRPLPWEIYRNRPIVYGMGNFVFEDLQNPLHPPFGWQEGYLAALTVESGTIGFSPIPYFQSRLKPGAVRMDKGSQEHFVAELQERRARLTETGFLELEWSRYCQHKQDDYLGGVFGHNRLMRKLARLFPHLLYSRERVLRALLFSRCETHREVLNTLFRDASSRGG